MHAPTYLNLLLLHLPTVGQNRSILFYSNTASQIPCGRHARKKPTNGKLEIFQPPKSLVPMMNLHTLFIIQHFHTIILLVLGCSCLKDWTLWFQMWGQGLDLHQEMGFGLFLHFWDNPKDYGTHLISSSRSFYASRSWRTTCFSWSFLNSPRAPIRWLQAVCEHPLWRLKLDISEESLNSLSTADKTAELQSGASLSDSCPMQCSLMLKEHLMETAAQEHTARQRPALTATEPVSAHISNSLTEYGTFQSVDCKKLLIVKRVIIRDHFLWKKLRK